MNNTEFFKMFLVYVDDMKTSILKVTTFFSMKTIVESSYFLEFEGKMWHVAHLNPWKWNKIVVGTFVKYVYTMG